MQDTDADTGYALQFGCCPLAVKGNATSKENPIMVSKELRKALVAWLSSGEWHYYATLNFNRTSSVVGARNRFRRLCQKLDRQLLGPKYQRYRERRTLIIAFQEHVDSNFHLHCLVAFRTKDIPSLARIADLISRAWREEVASGTVDVQECSELKSLASYITKETWRESHYCGFVISDEFIGDASNSTSS